MKTQTRDILRTIVVLAAIALVAGLLLGFIYPLTRLTQAELDRRAMKPLKELYPADEYEVVRFQPSDPAFSEHISYLFRAQKGEKEAYIVLCTGNGGYGGPIEMYVVFEGNEIVKMQKGSNKETNAIPDWYYEQFYGKDVTKQSSFVLGEGEGEVDKVVGSTMSSTGILNAVNNAVVFYRDFVTEGVTSEAAEGGTLFRVRANGYYVSDQGAKAYKYLRLAVLVDGEGVIRRVSVEESDFSPPPWSPGLNEENLNRYVGKKIAGSSGLTLGADIDNMASATGTSRAINRAINMVIRAYNGEDAA